MGLSSWGGAPAAGLLPFSYPRSQGFCMKVAHLDTSCLVCVDRLEALGLLRLASLALGSTSTASDDARFAMQLQSALMAALRDQLSSEIRSKAESITS